MNMAEQVSCGTMKRLWAYAREWHSRVLREINFYLPRAHHTDFHSFYASLPSLQQCVSAPLPPHHCQREPSFVFTDLGHSEGCKIKISKWFQCAFPWWLRMLHISLSISQLFELSLLRILSLRSVPHFWKGLYLDTQFFLSYSCILDISSIRCGSG